MITIVETSFEAAFMKLNRFAYTPFIENGRCVFVIYGNATSELQAFRDEIQKAKEALIRLAK